MPDFGVTTTGFRLKRLADILEDLTSAISAVRDPVTGESLTLNLSDENDPLVQVVNSLADQLATCWEQLEIAHNQFDPLKAVGAGLSGSVQLNGIRRRPGFPTTVQLTVTGTPGKVVAAGKRVSTTGDEVIFTLPTFTIGVGGTVSVLGTATEIGPLTALAGTVVKIVTPSTGWTAVTNPADATPGEAEQDDIELRELQQRSTENTGRGMIEDLYSAINNVLGVSYCRVYQNTALLEDERGIPAKAVAPVVQGGDEYTVAQAIFAHLPLGVDTFGVIENSIVDAQGFSYPIRFARPATVPVFVAITVKPFSPTWPTDAADMIKAAILEFAAINYPPGVGVFASQLYNPVNSVQGAQVTALTIGPADPPVEDAVAIDWNQVALFTATNIVVTEV